MQIVLNGIYNKLNPFINPNESQLMIRSKPDEFAYDNKTIKSANILIELMNETLEDIIYKNGIAFKTLINVFIEIKDEQTSNAQIILDKKIKPIKEIDPYVQLLLDLKKTKNRGQKRRLLARFNKTVGFGWGEYKKIYQDKNSKDEENQENPEEKRYKSQSETKLVLTDSNNDNGNTTRLSLNKYNRIQDYSEQKQIATKKFSQKINLKNAKTKYLRDQQNISLLINQSNADLLEEKTYVKVPGLDYKKAIDYLKITNNNSDNEKIQFENLIQDKRDELSVDIKATIKKKQGKIDQKLNENRKFTILNHIGEEKKKLVDQSNNHKLALESFENKLNAEITSTISHKIIELSTKSDGSQITFERQPGESSQLEFYKQKNELTKEKIKKGQELSKIKKIIKNKHVYKAQNHYNNTSLEHLPYEKDADISRTMQFENSISKK